MWWRSPHNPTAYDDNWEDQPGQGWFYKWMLGIAIPLGLGCWGLHAIIMREAEYGDQITMTLHGLNAVAFGVAWISASLFLHCHYFWGNIHNQAWFAFWARFSGHADSSPAWALCWCDMVCWESGNPAKVALDLRHMAI